MTLLPPAANHTACRHEWSRRRRWTRAGLAVAAAFALAGSFNGSLHAAAPALHASSSAGGQARILTVSRPSSLVPGELLVAALVANMATGAISPPPGWTLVRRDMSGNVGTELTQAVYYHVSDAGEPPSYTWRFDSPTSAIGTILAYRGVNRSRPIDAHAGLYTADAARFAAPSVRTDNASDRLLAFFGSNGANGISPPNGMKEDFDFVASNIGLEGASSTLGIAGPTGVKRASDSTGTANSSNFGQLVALRSACSGTRGQPRLGEPPVILDSAYVGRRVTTYAGTWCGKRPMRLAYRWQRCSSRSCTTIRSATRATYTPTRRDVDSSVRLLVTAQNTVGSTTVKSRGKRVGWARPTNTLPPAIVGTATVGSELTASAGSWTGVEPMTYDYQWQRCDAGGTSCGPIPGAKNATLVLGAGEVGTTIRVRVTATNSSGSASATSTQTAIVRDGAATAPTNTDPPAISGSAIEGTTITGSSGAWSGTAPLSYTYGWQRCDTGGLACSAIGGASGQAYVIGAEDVGSTMRLSVSAGNDVGSSSAISSPTSTVVVAPTPPLNTAPPSITGVAEVGSLVSASTGDWTGTSPMSYSYQWRRCDGAGGNCTSVSGASGSTYVVSWADGASTLRVIVTAANAVGSNVAISAPTALVPSAGSSVYWGAYMDGDPTYVYYYGGSWADAPWDKNTWNRFESNAGKKASIVHWGLGKPWDHDFNYFQNAFELVRNAGAINLVDMTTSSVPLRDIAGGQYDSYLTTWAQQAATWGRPFFLALDVEMNGSWEPYAPGVNGNTAADFVNMWRRFHDLADQAGATNITWVWCPNVDPGSKFTPYDQLYPGDSYVDWTCLDGYNKDGNQTFSWIFGSSYRNLLQIAPTKPVMISQTGSVEGGMGKAAWIGDALSTQLPNNFQQVKALVWFNWRIYENSRWWDWPIESSSSAQAAFRAAVSSPYYVPGGSLGTLPIGSKVTPP